VWALLRNLAIEFQSLAARRAWRKILKFTDSRFLNLALVQVNFKICARAAMLSRRRADKNRRI